MIIIIIIIDIHSVILYNVHCTCTHVQFTLYTVYMYIVYSVHVHCIQCTMYTVHVYIVQCCYNCSLYMYCTMGVVHASCMYVYLHH